MRLAELLSNNINEEFVQIEGFLDNNRLRKDKQKKLNVGKIMLNFYCRECNAIRTFCSNETLYCIGVDDKHISIDCVLECSGCNKLLPMWFLIESEGNIFSTAPYVRIIKREHKLSSDIILDNSYDAFSELIDKAECSYRCGFGAGAIVYLRIVLEQIVKNVADKVGISNINNSGRRKSFKDFLKEVDEQCHIVPREFSDNRYQLFSELSNCLHGLCDENISLQKYIPLKRLVKGIIDNIKNNREITSALESLNWNVGVENV